MNLGGLIFARLVNDEDPLGPSRTVGILEHRPLTSDSSL